MKIIKKINVTETLKALQVGEEMVFPYRQTSSSTVRAAAYAINVRGEASQRVIIPRPLRIRIIAKDVQFLLLFLVDVDDLHTDFVVVLLCRGVVLLQFIHNGKPLMSADHRQTGAFVHHDASYKTELFYPAFQRFPCLVVNLPWIVRRKGNGGTVKLRRLTFYVF